MLAVLISYAVVNQLGIPDVPKDNDLWQKVGKPTDSPAVSVGKPTDIPPVSSDVSIQTTPT